jgi:D-3-phosphoglycerate dehydrogenase
MQVIAYDLYPDQAFAAAHGVTFVELPHLLAGADVVSLHVAVTEAPPLIDREALALMKPSALLINTARGQLVDEAALVEALAQGRLAGAGLDVFTAEPPQQSPLLGLDKVVLTPHIGGRTAEGLHRMGEMTLENCLRALRGEPPLFQI